MTLHERMREEREEGYELGVQIGIQQGARDNKVDIAKKMMADGMTKDMILKYVLLRPEELDEIERTGKLSN